MSAMPSNSSPERPSRAYRSLRERAKAASYCPSAQSVTRCMRTSPRPLRPCPCSGCHVMVPYSMKTAERGAFIKISLSRYASRRTEAWRQMRSM